MLCNIKEKTINMVYNLICFLIRIISFFTDIVMHPIKNISCVSVVVLYVLLYKVNMHKLSGKEMFLFSAGMVTILTFIVTFLQSVTVESSNKEKFYFGYNLKRNLYDNFWIKRLHEMHVKLFLWSIFVIPCLRIATNYNYEYKILNDIIKFLKKNENNLYCIWLSIIIVVCTYSTAILIESINITKNIFRLSNFYNPRNERAKHKIKQEVEKEYKIYFENVINDRIIDMFNISYNQITAYDLTVYLFNKAKEVTNNQDEFDEYLVHAYRAEYDCINAIFIKIDNLINSICKIENSNILQIKVFWLRKLLDKVRQYYREKWNGIEQFSYYKYSFSAMCQIINTDLKRLIKLENKFVEQNIDIEKVYNDCFEGYLSTDKLFYANRKKVNNVCISQIIDVLINMCQDSEMYEQLNFNHDIYEIFITLCQGNSLKNYISKVFNCIFDYTFKCQNRDGNFMKEFCRILELGYCDQFIIDEKQKCSYNEIMSGNYISDFQLRWLLSLLNNNDVIVALIFRIAYAERSGKGYMSVDQYRIWKERIRELLYKNTLYELNNDRYVDELIKKIENSRVSHFIYPQFIKWLWNSLFVDFDSIMYLEFKKLGDKGIRNNFGLCSYIILRSLLLDEESIYNSLLFTKSENEEIQKEMLLIKDIRIKL